VPRTGNSVPWSLQGGGGLDIDCGNNR